MVAPEADATTSPSITWPNSLDERKPVVARASGHLSMDFRKARVTRMFGLGFPGIGRRPARAEGCSASWGRLRGGQRRMARRRCRRADDQLGTRTFFIRSPWAIFLLQSSYNNRHTKASMPIYVDHHARRRQVI